LHFVLENSCLTRAKKGLSNGSGCCEMRTLFLDLRSKAAFQNDFEKEAEGKRGNEEQGSGFKTTHQRKHTCY